MLKIHSVKFYIDYKLFQNKLILIFSMIFNIMRDTVDPTRAMHFAGFLDEVFLVAAIPVVEQ